MNSAQRNPRATSTQRLAHLVRALAPVILFFFVAFLLIFLVSNSLVSNIRSSFPR